MEEEDYEATDERRGVTESFEKYRRESTFSCSFYSHKAFKTVAEDEDVAV